MLGGALLALGVPASSVLRLHPAGVATACAAPMIVLSIVALVRDPGSHTLWGIELLLISPWWLAPLAGALVAAGIRGIAARSSG
jgi:hypothetical protein